MTRRLFLAVLLMLMLAPAARAVELHSEQGVTFGYTVYASGGGYRVKMYIYNGNRRSIQTYGRFGITFKNGSTAWMDPVVVGGRKQRYYVSTVFYRRYPQYQSYHRPSWHTL